MEPEKVYLLKKRKMQVLRGGRVKCGMVLKSTLMKNIRCVQCAKWHQLCFPTKFIKLAKKYGKNVYSTFRNSINRQIEMKNREMHMCNISDGILFLVGITCASFRGNCNMCDASGKVQHQHKESVVPLSTNRPSNTINSSHKNINLCDLNSTFIYDGCVFLHPKPEQIETSNGKQTEKLGTYV